jgi:LuxR family maltose regulon positive regulatory protein
LHLAAPEEYRRAFLDEGQELIDLLPRVRSLAPHFVDGLLADAGADPGLQTPPPGVQPLVEPLTEREMDTLRLVAEGLSNREIAGRLVLSVGTVKAHLHNIYGKLAVSGRTQALAKARELGLI